MDISFILFNSLNGLSYSMTLFLIASGLTIIFGLLDIPNFAHGSFYMLGAYVTYSFINYIIQDSFFIAIIIAFIVLGIVGGILEFLPLRRIYDRPHALQLLMTFSFILILDDSAKFLWGTSFKSVKAPNLLSSSITLPGGREFPIYLLFLIFMGIMVAFILWLILHKTKLGKLIHAGTSNKEMLGALGINVPKLFTTVFMLGSGLAGLGGGLASPLISIIPGIGDTIIITVFIIIIVGGPGSLIGAFISSILVGELTAIGILFMPRFAMIFDYILVIIVLLTKPEGLFGKES